MDRTQELRPAEVSKGQQTQTIDDTMSLMGATLRNMNAFLMKRLQEHGIKGIVPSHGDILNVLFEEERACMSTLAKRISRDPSTVTALVHKLQRQGYVEMERSTEDKRINIVKLTDAGRALEPVFREVSDEWHSIQESTLDAEQRESLHGMLEALYHAYDTEREEA
ncbi:MAG: MarR family winged helix-turn-helix transcriptional regulator [Coriobacteriales bacterium]|jgi:DNA-binding MarR family transcriptional regulator